MLTGILPHHARNFYPRSPCGERPRTQSQSRSAKYFYPRSPCGERRQGFSRPLRAAKFLSTLSLRRATQDPRTYLQCQIFLSTLSLRRATGCWMALNRLLRISIHALLAESDRKIRYVAPDVSSISIHALLAESDPPVRDIIQWEGIFLSTLSLRRATICTSIRIASNFYFYPRSPCGERR